MLAYIPVRLLVVYDECSLIEEVVYYHSWLIA